MGFHLNKQKYKYLASKEVQILTQTQDQASHQFRIANTQNEQLVAAHLRNPCAGHFEHNSC